VFQPSKVFDYLQILWNKAVRHRIPIRNFPFVVILPVATHVQQVAKHW
jgi:hypothetical protein